MVCNACHMDWLKAISVVELGMTTAMRNSSITGAATGASTFFWHPSNIAPAAITTKINPKVLVSFIKTPYHMLPFINRTAFQES
jgi:hypothetical protein